MEVDLGFDNLEPITLNLNDDFGSSSRGSGGGGFSSSNFGGGIELLMNDKKRAASNAVNVDLDDIDRLDSELNRFSSNKSINVEPPAQAAGGGLMGGFADFFGLGNKQGGGNGASNVDHQTDSGLGHATTNSMGNAKTWDGFSKMNEIPSYSASAGLSEREKRRKKRAMLKKLEEWNEKGKLKSANRFTMESSYEEIEDEYETAMEDKRKQDSIKLQGYWFMTAINTLEYANTAFNPFDLNLDGWGEQVADDMDSYEEIFAELYEKYKGGKIAPELSLLMRVGFGACMLNFTNKSLSSATPAFGDVIRQNPELMKAYATATAQSMSQTNPAVGFMAGMMNAPDQVNTSFGPPPKPVETNVRSQPPANRPDINAGRGGSNVFRQEGVEVNMGYADLGSQEKSTIRPRAEMRGPPQNDLDSILSGLKTKTVNIHENTMNMAGDNDSKLSISSLGNISGANVPKSSNRRNRSAKNVISVDI